MCLEPVSATAVYLAAADASAGMVAAGSSAAAASASTYMAAMSAAGTAMSAYGSYQQGQTQREMARYNAKQGEYQAEDALARGTITADNQRNRVRQIEGTQKAAMGASGAEVGSGTLGSVLDQTAMMGELDARTLEQDALRKAWGFKGQAVNTRVGGDMAAQAGTLQGFGTALAGFPRAYGIYKRNPNQYAG